MVKVGIVGGAGQMGRWFERLFKEAGWPVAISDINTKLTPRDLIAQCEAIIFSLPIDITAAEIRKLAQFASPQQILLDLTSIKAAAVEAMLTSQAEVLGLHPMFGPHIPSLNGQTIVFCAARRKQLSSKFLELFSAQGAKLKESTPADHDKTMSVIQGLTHFSAIVQALCMARLGTDIKESIEYASPIYRLRVDMIARIMAQDPKLYADIAMQNGYNAEVLKLLLENSKELLETILKGDVAAFTNLFQTAANCFGDFKASAVSDSDRAVAALAK